MRKEEGAYEEREGKRERNGENGEGMVRSLARRIRENFSTTSHQRQLRSEMRSDERARGDDGNWGKGRQWGEEERGGGERSRARDGRGHKSGERSGECTQRRRVRKRAFREYRSLSLDELTERRRRGSGREAGGEKHGGGDDDDDGRRRRKGRETRTEGRKKKKRRFRAAAGIAPRSCLWSRHAACAVFSARLTMPSRPLPPRRRRTERG